MEPLPSKPEKPFNSAKLAKELFELAEKNAAFYSSNLKIEDMSVFIESLLDANFKNLNPKLVHDDDAVYTREEQHQYEGKMFIDRIPEIQLPKDTKVKYEEINLQPANPFVSMLYVEAPPVLRGFIVKKSFKGGQSYRKRFFILEKGWLYYYKDSGKEEKGKDLRGKQFLYDMKARINQRAIVVEYKNKEKHSNLKMQLFTPYVEERDEWLDSLKEHIKYADKIS